MESPVPEAGLKPLKRKMKLPTAKEFISYYESQGILQEASMKVIENFQKQSLLGKIDATINRLTVLDKKFDSKPEYVKTALKGIGALVPHVIAPLGNIWNSVILT
uniref:Uncharacterized protein n=1 Tax=Cajanus cajan TaxID=3821 RepID=A0A151RYA9_CAJCA|nr:hypothetical protein KK1_030813 [Cajanus cajan]KYP67619.1 hypothetical protein KK1_023963 [Cajanus cajan]